MRTRILHYKNIHDIMIIIGVYTANVCPNTVLKFHNDNLNRFENIEQKWCLESLKLPVSDEIITWIIQKNITAIMFL